MFDTLLDIADNLSISDLLQYFRLWIAINRIQVQGNTEDTFAWRLSPSGCYSEESSYKILCQSKECFCLANAIRKSYTSMNCKVFIWFSLKYRIWKSDRRVSRGLQATISPCSLCLQEDETTDHMLVHCVLPIPQIQCLNGGTLLDCNSVRTEGRGLILLSCKLSGRNARVFGNNHQVFPEARVGHTCRSQKFSTN